MREREMREKNVLKRGFHPLSAAVSFPPLSTRRVSERERERGIGIRVMASPRPDSADWNSYFELRVTVKQANGSAPLWPGVPLGSVAQRPAHLQLPLTGAEAWARAATRSGILYPLSKYVGIGMFSMLVGSTIENAIL